MRALLACSLVLVLGGCGDEKPGGIIELADSEDTGAANGAPVVEISSHASGDVVDAAESITLEASVADEEDSPTALSLSWSSNVDGELGLTAVTADGLASLSTSGLSLGTHTLTLTATDTGGASGSDSVNLIVNDAPVVSHIAITPETALHSDELTCIWTLSDAFGVLSATGEWQVNGGSAGTGESGMTLSGAFESGDDVSCTVRPMDEHTAGLPVTTRITIDGIAPVLSSVTLSPSEVRTNDTLTAEVSTSDEDGDEVSVGYTWFVDDVEVDGETGPTLDGALHFDRDQSVHVVAIPSDGVLAGEPMSSDAIVVDNTPPTTPEISIETSSDGGVESSMTGGSSAMTSHETFVCVVTGESTDADGDEVTYAHTWALGGVDYPDATSTYEVGDTVSSDGGEPGSTWACSVTAHDGTDPSASAEVSYVSPCADGDGDGVFGLGCGGTDCDDMEASIHPGAEEICDGLDNDCDGLIDPATSVDVSTWYCDRDGDGYGVDDGTFTPIIACNDPGPTAGWADCFSPEWATNSDDCLDSSALVSPGVDEVCDGWDNNCDGVVDTDAVDRTRWYQDRDRDGFGSTPSSGMLACEPWSDWDSLVSTDCDDFNSTIYPGADERCNDVDDDCDGVVDGEDTTDVWYEDADGDGRGNPDVFTGGCPMPSGFVRYTGDCDDTDPDTHISADETCDGEDDDCNGVVDDDPVDATSYYRDSDGDGYGDPDSVIEACDLPSGYLIDDSDCDDDDPRTHPGAQDTPMWDRDCATWGGTPSEVTYSDYIFEGGEDALSGVVVAGAGDVDGDGLADVLIGAPNETIYVGSVAAYETGGVHLLLSANLVDAPAVVSTSDADHSLAGEGEGDEAGRSAASAGDLDGDGLDDIVIGAPNNSEGAAEAGKAYVVLASSLGSSGGSRLSSSADYTMISGGSSDHMGQAVAGVTGLDGDGAAALMIAAPSDGAGRVALVRGSSLGASSSLDSADSDWLLVGEDGVDRRTGHSLASAGDVDGDGLTDLVIGAPGRGEGSVDTGRVHVVLGAGLAGGGTLDLGAADYTYAGTDGGDQAGWSVASAGDFDGDGLDDILIGAPGHDDDGPDTGRAYLVLGSSAPALDGRALDDADITFICNSVYPDTPCRLGFSLAGLGHMSDVSPDDSVIFGIPDERYGGQARYVHGSEDFVEMGVVYLQHGWGRPLLGETTVSHGWTLGELNLAGWSVASPGDVNGDGAPDVLLGDPELSRSYLIFNGL